MPRLSRTRLVGLAIFGCALVSYQHVGWSQRFPPLTPFTSTEPSVLIVGPGQSARTGFSVATGDINGDGKQDVVISSSGWNSPSGGKGEFEILWGPLEDGQVIHLNQTVSGLSRIVGQPNDAPLFASLWCSDINRDGNDDIIIGEPQWSSFRGRGYVVFGSASFPDTVDLANTSQPFLTILGPAADAWFGLSACAGDVDGNGYSDALLSAYGIDEVVLVRGGTNLPAVLDASSPSENLVRIRDDLHPGQGLGERLTVKDVNDDGFTDILFGCNGNAVNTWNGMAILLFGAPNLPQSISLGSTDMKSVTITNSGGVDFLGSSVAIVDFDADAKDDLIIGADGVDGPAGENCGSAFVLYSAVDLPAFIDVGDLSVPATIIMGSAARTWWGNSILGADFDFDGFDDVTMRCVSIDTQPASRDTVAVVYGRSNRPDTIWVADEASCSKFASELYDESLGRGIASSDLNDDGRPDLVLPAFRYDANRGRVFVVFGTTVTPVRQSSFNPISFSAIPNPFSSTTRLSFSLPIAGRATLVVYDVHGKCVARLASRSFAAGDHGIYWDGRDDNGRRVAQGIYFARIETRTKHVTRKLTLVR